MGWLSVIMGSRLGQTLGAILMSVLAVLTLGKIKKREGREEAENDALRDASERVESGRDAVRAGRNKSPDERLRENDGSWR